MSSIFVDVSSPNVFGHMLKARARKLLRRCWRNGWWCNNAWRIWKEGDLFLPWGTNRGGFQRGKPMKTLRQRKEHGGFQAKLMKNEHKQYRKWSIGQPIHQVFSPLRMAWDIWTWARCGSRVPWICWFQDVSRVTNKQRDSIRLTRKI